MAAGAANFIFLPRWISSMASRLASRSGMRAERRRRSALTISLTVSHPRCASAATSESVMKRLNSQAKSASPCV